MPKLVTLRKYYPKCKLSDELLMKLAEFVRKEHDTLGIAADSKDLKILIAWEETKV